jgi:hypothetical protein
VKIFPHGGLWLEDRRVEGAMYEGHTIKKTTNIGIAKVRCSILSGFGILTIGDLKNMSAHTKQQIVEERKMTSDLLMKLQHNIKDAILGDAPAKFDHRKTDNPYKSMYGDEWNVEILKTAHFNKVKCIAEMVEHIVDKTREIMKDTKYENYFYFYHDALSQMTCRKTTAWMIMTGYINHWILPSSGVNSGTIYAKHPPGDSPEFMPLDTSLFGDAHACVNRHVMITEALSESDVNKFSLATPRRVASAYLRILNPVAALHQRESFRIARRGSQLWK